MADSQKAGASENDEIVVVTPPEDPSGELEATDQPDLSELREQFAQVKSNIATRAEIESLKRQAGHVPTLQRELAELKAQQAESAILRDRLDAYELLLMDVLPPTVAGEVESQRQSRTQEQMLDEKLKPILERLEAPPVEEPSENFAVWELRGRLDAATAFVKQQATKVGIDPESIPSEVWAGAQNKHGLDVEAATLDVLQYVNEQASKGSASDRRTERKAAASGGNPGERSGAMGQYDMTTLKGAAQARRDGAIDSEEFMKVFRRVQSGR